MHARDGLCIRRKRSIMVRHILVPLDGSPLAAAAIPYAATLARALAAPICLLAVVEPFPDLPGVPSDHALEGDDRLVATRTAYLDAVATALRAPDLAVRTTVRHGNPAGEILRESEEEAGALVIMSTHGRTGLARLRLGSVAQHVVRHGTTPTLVVRPGQGAATAGQAALTEVTVTLDGSTLAEEALPLAAQLATALAVPLALLRVIPSLSALATSGWDAGYAGYAGYYPVTPEMERDEERAVADYLEAVAAPLRTPEQTVLTRWQRSPTARAEETIAAYLAERPTGIATMASHGRGGVLRWVLGSNAEAVLDQAPCPLLIIRAGATLAAVREAVPVRTIQHVS